MSWQKEKQEHPWTTKAQAKRIAKDHQRTKQEHRHHPQKGHQGIPAIQAATADAKGLHAGFSRITYGKHELGR